MFTRHQCLNMRYQQRAYCLQEVERQEALDRQAVVEQHFEQELMQDPTYVQLVESQSTAATGTAPSILVMGEPQLNSAPIVPDINLNEWEAQPLDSGYSPQIGGELPTMQILIPEGFVPPDQQHLSADEMIAHRMMAGEENVVSETRMACLERWDAEWRAANPEGRGGNRLLEALNDCPEEPAGGVPWAAIGLGLLFLL